jgi:hypothetical protein
MSWLSDIQPALFLARDSNCGTNNGFLPGLYDNLCSGGKVQIESVNDIVVVIGNVIRILIAFAGALAVIFIIVGAIYFITATGDPGRLKRAKDILTQAVTGLIIVLVAYAAVTFIAQRF